MKIMKIKNWKTFNENIQENLEDEFVEITFTENCEIEYYDQAFPGDSEEDIENLEPKYQEYFVSDKEEVDVFKAYKKTLINKWLSDKITPKWSDSTPPEWFACKGDSL